MAMAAPSCCTGLPMSSPVSSSHSRSHQVETTISPQLIGFPKLKRQSGAVSGGSKYSCAASVYGPSLRHASSRQERRRARSTQQRVVSTRCESTSNGGTDEKIPFGYTRKDVILIGVGLTVFGVALKYGLEFFGVDSLRAGNVVQIVMVAGLTIGWISTYVFRVSTKEMTYAKQLKDYENKVMEKRLEELPEAELENMLAQVEEDKRRLQETRDKRSYGTYEQSQSGDGTPTVYIQGKLGLVQHVWCFHDFGSQPSACHPVASRAEILKFLAVLSCYLNVKCKIKGAK